MLTLAVSTSEARLTGALVVVAGTATDILTYSCKRTMTAISARIA